MPERAEIYVPATARFPDDLRIRHALLEPARIADYQTGLMLLIKPGDLSTPDGIRQQIDNLDPFVRMTKGERPKVFGMHPNKPLSGPQRLNFFDNAAYTQEQIERSTEFVAQLPSELTPADGRLLTFHLNTLIRPEDWVSDEDYWAQAFETVLARIRESVAFAQRQNVSLAVETVPIPEFGDMSRTPEHLLDDGTTHWADLGNPWPLLFWRDEIQKLRDAGTRIVTDVCHSFIAVKAVQEVGRLDREGKGSEAYATYMVHPSDVEAAASSGTFSDMVLQNTKSGDVWHLNDARGMHTTDELQGAETYFEEGVALFEGDIPVQDMSRIVREGLDMPIKLVLEMNETDYVQNPHTKRSLEALL